MAKKQVTEFTCDECGDTVQLPKLSSGQLLPEGWFNVRILQHNYQSVWEKDLCPKHEVTTKNRVTHRTVKKGN